MHDHSSVFEEARRVYRELCQTMAARGGAPAPWLTVDVRPAQARLLLVLKKAERLTGVGLAERLNVTDSAVSRTVEELVDAGYLTATRQKADRRLVWYELTPEGEQAVEEMTVAFRGVVDEILERLPPEEIQTLVTAWSTLVEQLDHLPPAEPGPSTPPEPGA